ncbi:MAG TPA: translation initiation factor IF-2 N-terminal domain-containing protein, partial [Bryobacteraceae bacterium]|nr:translation initiation factor IF-2 N-terminal domain-containing protein [Bryobacteraceae bacterium]
MKKIRINVLARELEVKSHLILELLPDLGVTEKLTHSSSIDEDVADKLRVRFGIEPVGSGNGPSPAHVEVEEGAQAAEPVRAEPQARPVESQKEKPAAEAAPPPVKAEPQPEPAAQPEPA